MAERAASGSPGEPPDGTAFDAPATQRPAGPPEPLPTIALRPIGIIHTPFVDVAGVPIQSAAVNGTKGSIELDPAYEAGLAGLAEISHLILVYHLHLAAEPRLTVLPFLDDRAHGVFATRSPARPNGIGISTVRLLAVKGTRLEIEDVDMIDGTPLLDIKPYVPAFDDRSDVRIGWYAERLDLLPGARADDRFAAPGEQGRGQGSVERDPA